MSIRIRLSHPSRATFLVGGSLALLLSVARPAHAEPTAPAQASASEAEHAAQQAYAQGRYEDALAAYEQAHRRRPLPRTLLGVARAAEGAGDKDRAREAYERYLTLYPNAANRRQIEAQRARLSSTGEAPTAAPAPRIARAPEQDAPVDPDDGYVTSRPLKYLPLGEILTRQRALQHRLDTRDGLSLGGPVTLLVLGLLTAGPVGGVLFTAGLDAEEKDDSVANNKAMVIPGGVLIGVGLVGAITGATMIATRRGRARSIRRSLSELDFELGKRRGRAAVAPMTSFSSRTVGLTGTVTF